MDFSGVYRIFVFLKYENKYDIIGKAFWIPFAAKRLQYANPKEEMCYADCARWNQLGR
jgi:hypothetical protein